MTTPFSTIAGADLLTPFGRGRGSLRDSFWYTGWLLSFLATGDQTQGRFALIDALTRKGNCPPLPSVSKGSFDELAPRSRKRQPVEPGNSSPPSSRILQS